MTIFFRVRRPHPGLPWPPPDPLDSHPLMEGLTEWPGEEKGKVADEKEDEMMFRAAQAFTDHPVPFIGGPELPKGKK